MKSSPKQSTTRWALHDSRPQQACGRTVFVNAHRAAAPSDDEPKDRAVRKLVRAIIEGNGGDGADVKKNIDAKYWTGTEWSAKEQKLTLKCGGLQYQDAFHWLMLPKAAE